ncbi:MAG: RHS repeat domain-containing protein [Blastocatellales bacterium]
MYNYDAANRLKEVGVGGSNTYGYDGDGMRVRQSSGGMAMFYVRSSVLKNVAMEVTATGGAVRAYVQAGNKTVAMSSRDGQFYWLHTNHLNSSRSMTDINGTLVYKGQFDPYGKALLEWSATSDTGLNTRKFTGYERDATGLDYANARTYASERGRFIQPDPIGIGGVRLEQPQSMNRYAYVQNDPINFVDKSGLLLESPDGISGSGSDCQSIFVAVDWSSSDGPTGTGVLSYGFTYRSCVTSSGGSSVGGTDFEPDFKQKLIDALRSLSEGCKEFFGGSDTINMRIEELQSGRFKDLKVIDMRVQGGSRITNDPLNRTYQQYWDQQGWGPVFARAVAINDSPIDYQTILLGSLFFRGAALWGLNQIIGANDISHLQDLILVHEYMHILNNMNEGDLYRKWTSGNHGADINDRIGLGPGSVQWMANGCKRKN